jgi:DNA-binding CsgD family transcriptional regulator
METLRAWLALGESTLEIRPATPSHAQKKPVGRIGLAHTPNHAQPTPNQSRPVSPSHAHAQPENQEGNEQIIEILEETTGFSDAQPVGFLVRPTTLGEKPDAQTPYQAPILGELGEGGRNHAQPAPNHAQPPTPKLGIPLRLVENHPTLTAFQITVQDLMAAGKSERQIAETTGKGRHAVRAAKAAIDKHATENCKEGKAPK